MSLTRLLLRYQTVKELHNEKGYTIQELCPLVHTARSSYYKWLNHPKSSHELENEKISTAIQEIYKEHPDKGHRRIRDDLKKTTISVPAPSVHPNTDASSCQCHELGCLTNELYKKFAVPLVKRRMKSYIIFSVYLTECTSVSGEIAAVLSFMLSSTFCKP